MAEMDTIVAKVSILQKNQAGEWASKHDMSVSKLVRLALAAYTGYDLEAELATRVETRGRPRKYATPAEAAEAARKRTRERDELARALVQNYHAEQREKDVLGIQRSLERRGKL